MPVSYSVLAASLALLLAGALVALAFAWRAAAAARSEVRRQADRGELREARLKEFDEELRRAGERLREAESGRADGQSECARLGEAVRQLEQAAAGAAEQIEAQTGKTEGLQAEVGRLAAANQVLRVDADGKLASARREVEALTAIREDMERRFKEIAAVTLKETGTDVSKAHVEKLTELLTPFREHVGRFEVELRAVHKSADEERTKLAEQLRGLTEQTRAISAEATNLTRALKGDRQRQGAWGEMVLERILEESALVRDRDYQVQVQRRDDEGARWRPDVVVRMPRGKCLVIDSKVNLVDYEAASSAESDDERERHLRAHVAAVRRHVDALAAKGYGALEEGSVDYVLMFMPIEGALSEAWRQQDDLTTYAAQKGVGIVTPTTLMLALKIVDHIWTVERREQNAEAIAARAGLLHDKLVGFCDDMGKVERALGTARGAFDDAMGKLSRGGGNLIGQADKLKRLGARTQKSFGISFEPEEDDSQLLVAEAAE